MAYTPITTGSELSLLRPGLKSVFMDMNLWQDEWMEFNKRFPSDKAVEFMTEMKPTGLAAFTPEGTPIPSDGMNQMFVTQAINKKVSLSFTITLEALQDNLYKDQFPRGALSLKNSMRQFKDIQGAAQLNNGFNTLNPIADGQPLFSTAHPIVGGIVANTFTIPTGFNETSLEDALIGIQLFLNAAGLKVAFKAMKMIIPPQLEFSVKRVLGSKYRTGTANNDINASYSLGSIPEGAAVNHFVNNPTQWTIITNCEEGFKYFERQALETDIVTDPLTNNLTCKAWERYSFTNDNFRSCWGAKAI